MAIIIEEEKGEKLPLATFITWGAILAAVLVAVFYIFRRPEVSDVNVPPELQRTRLISEQIKIDPDAILNNPKFRLRKRFVEPPQAGNLGKANPFIPL